MKNNLNNKSMVLSLLIKFSLVPSYIYDKE